MQRLPINIIFQAPTIATLTHVVVHAVHDDNDGPRSSMSSGDLVQLVEQYVASLAQRLAPSQLVEREVDVPSVVLVTGTTGGFGSDLLEHLLLDDGIRVVYALNRKGSTTIEERQLAQFKTRNLQVHLLASPKLRMIEGDLTVPGLGVPAQVLEEV